MTVKAGDKAPQGTALDQADRTPAPVELSEVGGGRPALVVFYKSECGASLAAAPLLPRFASISGLTVVAGRRRGERGLCAKALSRSPVRVLLDPPPWKASDAFGVAVTPTLFLIAKDGRIECAVEGFDRKAANDLAASAARLCGSPGGLGFAGLLEWSFRDLRTAVRLFGLVEARATRRSYGAVNQSACRRSSRVPKKG